MISVPIEQAHDRLRELIDAAIAGENVILTTKSLDAVRLVPVVPQAGSPLFGSARDLIEMSSDFDEPLDDFREYMESAK